ncbi:MAG: FAD-dependent oxidoreductase [Candidatus Micrarchaeota archaeon]|nr:FAD-dependent oxidoreductase [Candidatus Micrarchaeota archaeon]
MVTSVHILGAGISGLSAAYFLKDKKTEIYEASHEPGGRIRVANIGGQWIDLGAQFIAKEDKQTMELVRSLGLSNKMRVFDLSKFFVSSSGNKLDSKHLFELADLQIKEIEEFFSFLENLNSSKFSHLFDEIANETFYDWYNCEFGGEMIWLMDSICRTVAFVESKDLSAFFGLAVVSSFLEDCYSFDKGLNEITDSLLRNIKSKINYGAKVTSIEFGKSPHITMEHRGLSTQKKVEGPIISAIPAPELATIVNDKGLSKALKKVKYMGCGVVAFETDEEVFSGKLGAMFLKEKVSAAFDSTARFGSKKGIEEVIIALIPSKGEEGFDYPKLAIKSLSEFDPKFESKIRSTTVVEWKFGLPICSTKLFEVQKEILESSPEGLFVVGDFMGLPSIDASIETAYACAKNIKQV